MTTQHTTLNTFPERLKKLVALALPIFIGGAVMTSYHLINAFWVGRLGPDSVAIVATCFPINLLMISIGSGLSQATSIMVSQHHGAEDYPARNHLAAQAMTTVALLALLLSTCGYLFAPHILKLMVGDGELAGNALAYLRITFMGTLFLFIGAIYQSILRGIGQARAPLRVVAGSVLLNALLDPLLIFGVGPFPAIGVTGAAYATVITQFIAAVIGVRLMLRPEYGIEIKRQHLRPNFAIMIALIRLGLPASIEQSMQAITVTVMTTLAAKFGAAVLAAYGIIFRVLTFSLIPSLSIAMATSILTGQAAGAGDKQNIRTIAKTSALFGLSLMLCITATLFFCATPIMKVFVPDAPELIQHGTQILRILALSLPLTGIQMAVNGSFRGTGNTFNVMLITLFGIWAIQIPTAYVLSQHTSLGVTGLWWSSVIAALISTSITLSYYQSSGWLNKNLREGHEPPAVKLPIGEKDAG